MARARSDVTGQATAGAKYLRISSPKLNQVAALIRGQHVDEARRVLAFTPKSASRELSKVLEAAIANAENNYNLHADELFVKEVRADEGPTLKRFRPRALGRAYRIRKRTSHLHIIVERRAPEAPARAATSQAAGRRWRRGGQGQEGAATGATGDAAAAATRGTRRRTARAQGAGRAPGTGRAPGRTGRTQGRSGKGGQRGS